MVEVRDENEFEAPRATAHLNREKRADVIGCSISRIDYPY